MHSSSKFFRIKIMKQFFKSNKKELLGVTAIIVILIICVKFKPLYKVDSLCFLPQFLNSVFFLHRCHIFKVQIKSILYLQAATKPFKKVILGQILSNSILPSLLFYSYTVVFCLYFLIISF